MIRRGLSAAALAALVAVLAATSAANAQPFYEGYVSRLGFGKTRVGSQGAGWQAVFKERARGRVRYRVCLTHEENGVSACVSRTTRVDGSSVVFAAIFINDRGGPGPWHATWLVRGRGVARWDFTVRPEGV
jgi:hypothetical protein